MKDQSELDVDSANRVDHERRRALSRLGLGLSAAYAVPTLLTLSMPATAFIGSGDGGSGGASSVSGRSNSQ